MASADTTDKLICSICLNNCEDPKRLRCRHNICKDCSNKMLETQEASGDLTCPDCIVEFQERPVLPKKKTLNEDSEIFCSNCTFSPLPAVISCLNCKVSLCDKHLRIHSKSEEHIFTKLNFTCSTHKKRFRYYCSEDATYNCVSCFSENHQGHQVEPLTSDKENGQLRSVLEKLAKSKKATEERVKNLQQYIKEAQQKASALTERVVTLFRDTRTQLNALEHKIVKDISNQEEQVRASAGDLICELETKIAKLSRDIKDMEGLYTKTKPLPAVPRSESVKHDIGDIEEALDQDRIDLDVGLVLVTLHTALSDIVTNVKRGFYVEHAQHIEFDINTASNDIHISGDLKSVSGSDFKQNRPKLPERFQQNQVLSTRSFSSGRHFLEVETDHTGNWRLGMSYPSIARKGYHSHIGHSGKSWGLCRYLNQYFVIHNRNIIRVSHKPSSQRLGILLDYEAGCIGFYELSDQIRLLHTYSTTFNEALHLILAVYMGWVRIRN
ncbi:hypothetical protein GDO78_020768 [Eleutherodactylus coqui]|uniref:Uncharacterized protein n=1 Tax=Eleutherodactylus coqui TaxID=57060 RepID=A0A8J6BB42_ELECQ|nr:hypothetical protein GDO78_020768 [Eleutherodactylus coqui]